MLTMFTALEASATAYLISPKDYSLYQHIEIRILDCVQHGGTHILYMGEMTDNVLRALDALGYTYVILEYDEERAYRISWDQVKI